MAPTLEAVKGVASSLLAQNKLSALAEQVEQIGSLIGARHTTAIILTTFHNAVENPVAVSTDKKTKKQLCSQLWTKMLFFLFLESPADVSSV